MALGTGIRNNGNQQKEYNPTVYSRISFSNRDGSIDQTRLSFSHWNGMLKVSIAPHVVGSEENFDNKNAIALHLSVPKAYILMREIQRFVEDRRNGTTNFFYGVNTAKGLIGIMTGQEYGYPEKTALAIMRMDEEGNILSTYAYEFKPEDYYSAIRNFKPSTREFEKYNYEDVEIDLILEQLRQFVQSMSMSQAYACVDGLKYQNDTTFRSLNQIKEQLGIKPERRSMGAGEFFNGANTAQPPKTSYDSVSDALGNSQPLDDDVPF